MGRKIDLAYTKEERETRDEVKRKKRMAAFAAIQEWKDYVIEKGRSLPKTKRYPYGSPKQWEKVLEYIAEVKGTEVPILLTRKDGSIMQATYKGFPRHFHFASFKELLQEAGKDAKQLMFEDSL